jgi:hypothetical protein
MVGQEKNLRTGVVVNINSYPGIDNNLRFAGNVIYMDGRGMGDTRILNDLDPGEELFVFYLADYFGDGSDDEMGGGGKKTKKKTKKKKKKKTKKKKKKKTKKKKGGGKSKSRSKKQYMPGSTIPRQNQYVKTLLQEEGTIAKGKACEGLPKEMIHTMIENQVETGYTPENCDGLRLLCQNPSCEKHCWNAPPITKQVIDGCKEVMKVKRCLSVLKDYKLIRVVYKGLIDDNYELDYTAPGLSYFHREMKRRIQYPPPFGPYKLMIGDYDDEEVELEIKELKDDLSKTKDIEDRDIIQGQLFQANREKIAYKLPKAGQPYVFTDSELKGLEKIFNEKDDIEDENVWSKYTIKSCFHYLFGKYPELFQELCLLFIDENIDSDGEEIFTQEELIPRGYPNASESFLNGNIIMDIGEALDLFFEVDMVTWVQMLQVFENKGFPEDEKNILKQKFLNMIGFLDGLYIEKDLNNLETGDK